MAEQVIKLQTNAPSKLEQSKNLALFLKALLRNRGAVAGGSMVLLLIALALLAPSIAPYDPYKMGAGKKLEEPSLAHIFGTDEFGRDLFSRIVFGAGLTLQVGSFAVGISLVCGVTLGLVAGYGSGVLESIIMRSVDVLFSFTDALIALAALAILGPSMTSAMIAVGIGSIPFYARVTYSAVLVEKHKQYFEAARAVGVRPIGLILHHILPNILSPLIVVATLGISSAVLSAAGLSFLGLGAQPPSPEWGVSLATGRNFINRAPWMVIFPGLAIVITVLSFNLLGDGIREALDPRQRKL